MLGFLRPGKIRERGSKMLSPYFAEDRGVVLSAPKSYDFAKLPPSGSNTASSRHGRSQSAPLDDSNPLYWDVSTPIYQDLQGDRRHYMLARHRLALEQDVILLQMRLREEEAIRVSLEKALVNASSSLSPGRRRNVAPKTRELIAETALLEYEVAHLEQHLLSLYRRLLMHHLPSVLSPPSTSRRKCSPPKHQDRRRLFKSVWQKQHDTHLFGSATELDSPFTPNVAQKSSKLISSSGKLPLSKDVKASPLHHLLETIQPRVLSQKKLSEMPVLENTPGYLYDIFAGTTNELSEELVRCMAGIYCKLADPPMFHRGSSSPMFSPGTGSCAKEVSSSDGWSPLQGINAGLISNPFQLKEQLGNVGAYRFMVEIPWICVDKNQLVHAAHALHTFKTMVKKLSDVDLTTMKRNEKLAFWINIYNAMIMHAHLAYGIPTSRLKRAALLQKAAYKVGTYSVNAHTIEQCILGSRPQSSGQWLQAWLSPAGKLKSSEEKRAYGLSSAEPLVCFALCSGARSDPAVRVYTAKNVKEELEIAKSDFLQASVGGGGGKVVLPRLLQGHLRDIGVSTKNLVEWLCNNLPDQHCSSLKDCLLYQLAARKNYTQCFEWMPCNLSFRYIFARDLHWESVNSMDF